MVNLRSMREKRKLTQRELSTRSGVPQQTISSIESGERRNPGVETLYLLCCVLKCTIDDLYIPDHEEKAV